MKKKIVALLLVGIMCMIQGAYAATMYSLDGRIIEVNDSEIEAYRQVNWFYGKPVTMYAADGRTLYVPNSEVTAYQNVGWYKTYSEAQASVRTYTYTSNSSQTESNYEGVYRTPTVKRYHFDSNCGGKNSYKTTLQKAKSAGLTPCKKCAW